MPNYSNPVEYTTKLTPVLRNLATEGGLDTSIFNGVSLQRTLNMLQVNDQQGRLKIVSEKDGAEFNNVITNPFSDGWITVVNTAYLYPVVNVNTALVTFRAASPAIIENGNDIIFTDATHLYNFFEAAYLETANSQPIGNAGYSLGVGTKLQDLGITVNLVLQNGLKMITWRLVKQLTSQPDLPAGGDSPDNTIGFIPIYTDWDQDGVQDPLDLIPSSIGYEYGDPLRVSPDAFVV